MQLTILYPEAIPLIAEFSGGLMPIRLGSDRCLSLVIKGAKEAILAAKMRSGISLYVPTLIFSEMNTLAIITAFFDDEDEPLTIRTPLFYGEFSSDLLEILSRDHVDTYFFDEHNYEWMSFKSSLHKDGEYHYHDLNKFELPVYSLEKVMLIDSYLVEWFGNRTIEDDHKSIKLRFKEMIFRNDIVVIDMQPTVISHIGSLGFRKDSLDRNDPGYFQERDIAACLQRSFSPNQIFLNPKRVDNFKELLDVLVITANRAILIQAKDSPNTNESITRSIERKRRVTHHQILKAIRQVNGAARYIKDNPNANTFVNGTEIYIDIAEKVTFSIVVVKELFEDEAEKYAEYSCKYFKDTDGGIVIDYNTFHHLTYHFRPSENLYSALEVLIARAKTHGWISVRRLVFNGILDLLDHPNLG